MFRNVSRRQGYIQSPHEDENDSISIQYVRVSLYVHYGTPAVRNFHPVHLSYSRLDRNLERTTAAHLVQCLLVILQGEDIRDLPAVSADINELQSGKFTYHALHVDFPAVQVCNRTGEAECLRERADDLSNRMSEILMSPVSSSARRTLISSPKIFEGGQWTKALFS